VCTNPRVERRKFWWNGRWGRLSRRDLLVYVDGEQWWVEVRDGGAEGRVRWLECVSADAAFDLVRDLMSGTDGWAELPPG
jgi:hypothetical protein